MSKAALAVCGGVLSLCVATWARQGDQTGRIGSYLGLHAVAFAAYLAGLAAASSAGPRAFRAALGAAVIWRAALVLAPPLLSDDVHRYVWEGRIQRHGGNPYAWSDRPEAARWAALRDDVWAGVSHKDYTAIYPPLWQLAARAVVSTHDSVVAMKAFAVGCELLTWWLLARLLRAGAKPAERLLILAWSPLALVEIAGSGHNEALGMLLATASLAALESGRPFLSAMAAAAAAQAKLVPGLFAVAWARRYRPAHVAAAAALALVLVWPYASAGAGLWRSLGKYGEFWRFNETLFALLAVAAPSHAAAVRLAVVLVVAVAVALAWRNVEPAAAALAVCSAWLLLTPNVLPWYALWLVPLLVLRDAPPLLLFTGTVALAYLVYPAWRSGEPWRLGWAVRALEYGPCAAVALWWWLAPRGLHRRVPRMAAP